MSSFLYLNAAAVASIPFQIVQLRRFEIACCLTGFQ